MEAGRKVVVTTKHRGVFFGTVLRQIGSEIHLADARVCVHWSAQTRGFVGLAVTGPLEGSRVSPAAPEMEIVDVTSVTACSDAAVAQWESGLWR